MKDKTLIATIGNSRVYGIKDGKIVQITKDETKGQMYYELKKIDKKTGKPIIANEEDIKFYKGGSNLINALGVLKFTNNPTFICIDNKDIDTLLFMTDGVHERVDPEELVMIVNKYSDRKMVVEAILEAANKNSPQRKKSQEPKRKGLFQRFLTSNKSDSNYIDSIPAGGDNLTVAGIDISQEDSEQSGPEM